MSTPEKSQCFDVKGQDGVPVGANPTGFNGPKCTVAVVGATGGDHGQHQGAFPFSGRRLRRLERALQPPDNFAG